MIFRRLKRPDPEKEREFNEAMKDETLTKSDTFAMMLSAFLTVILPCLLILGAFGMLFLWMFGAF